ncbi:MAG: hypothetical protein QOE70_6443 [Chthoniobacter sp.]|jgi:glycosyltransferase involved in cell wall biosynthesis|nr:hypothetical protein [Chthoniobacter sp.]
MRITIVQGAFFPVPALLGGAVEKIWFALGQRFAAAGHAVTHVSRRYANLPQEETIGGVQHIRVPGFAATSSLLLLKARDLIYSFRARRVLPHADILVTNTFWMPILARSRSAGALYVHVQRYPRKQMGFYRHAARIQTVSGVIERAIKEQAPQLRSKVRVIPNPLPDETEPPSREKEKVILFAGRIHPEKGLELLVQAFALLRERSAEAREWRLLLAGPWRAAEGGGGEDFRHMLRGRNVEMLGPIFDAERLRELYARAAIFVYPSLADRGEASPVAPLEAMAAGCATVLSDLDCFADYARLGENAVAFDHRSPNADRALAGQLHALMCDPARRQQLGECAVRTARQYTAEKVAALYLDDFGTLIDER